MSHPRLGQHVFYTLSESDVIEINSRRNSTNLAHVATLEAGGLLPVTGNSVREGDQLPAVLVRNSGATWNLQVALDGTDSHWATSRSEGDGPGKWQTRVTL